MKKNIVLVCMLIICIASKGQKGIDEIKNRLENGIFVRNMEMESIRSNVNQEDDEPYSPENKITCNYMKFYAFEKVNSNTEDSIYIGKVFMSERYEDEVFAKKFDSLSKFIDNCNGYYMICKLFISGDNFYKINIYPNYELNVCNKKEHKFKFKFVGNDSIYNQLQNGKYCNSEIEDKSYQMDTHYKKFKQLVTLRDYETEDFWQANNKSRQELAKTINYSKMIKCFKINFINGNIAGFELNYTKNAKSNDKSYLTKYTYDYRPFHIISALGSYHSFIGHYRSQNKITNSQFESEKAEPLKYFIKKNGIYYRKSLDFGIQNINDIKETEITLAGNKSYKSRLEPNFIRTSSHIEIQDSSLNSKKGCIYLGTFLEDPIHSNEIQIKTDKPIKSGYINKSKNDEINIGQYIIRKSSYLYDRCPSNSNPSKKIIQVVEKDSKITIIKINKHRENESDIKVNIWAEITLPNQ